MEKFNYPKQNEEDYNKFENIKERLDIFMDDVKNDELKKRMEEAVKKLENLEK
ncbi:hypothetical protein J6W91_03025 [Candidatus Saccharibacteria bacterium]|nr:hypothetical protein [Candidatus Saccharibacteria bacterium]